MSIINSKIPIFCNDTISYKNTIFYERKYYCLSEHAKAIYIYNETFHFLSKVKLEYYCDNMTFCYKKKCFYFHARNANNTNKIIITDMNFKVMKEIYYKINDAYVRNLCYSENENVLYLITNYSIIKMDEFGKFKKVLSIYQINQKLTNKNSDSSKDFISNFTAASVLHGSFYLSYCRNNKSYFAKIKNGEIIDEHFIDVNCDICNILDCNGNLQLLIRQKYNYLCITDIYLDLPMESEKSNTKIKENCNHLEKNKYTIYCKENYSNCRYHDIENFVPEHNGIANLLYYEGSELQQSLDKNCSMKELLTINSDLNNIIVNVTMLEQELYFKLQTIANNNCN